MKIAVIGSGVSGLTSAYLLSQKHDVVVYEASDRLGGHTATIDVQYAGQSYAVDTGFIVFNDWTYPLFETLLAQLKVESQPTDMGFSVSCDETGLEYSGDSLNTLFAQRRNIVNPRHWLMIKDILRFNKQAPLDVAKGGMFETMTLGEYLTDHRYNDVFIDKYLVPMGSAIWSASTSVMRNFPLQFFVKFFINHGLLSVNNRPQWRVVTGGSKSYIEPLTASFKNNIRLSTSITSITRHTGIDNDDEGGNGHVIISSERYGEEKYDQVVIATHSDQALALLSDASDREQQVLGDITYRNNDVVLHTDDSLLPRNKKTWSSWNYRITDNTKGENDNPPVLTYNMNILQGINAPCTFCVTLNSTDQIDPEKIIGRYQYAHPVFSLPAIAAQQHWQDINGVNNTWFCGAYWANGFHEDGVKSAVRIAEKFGISLS
ncbi:MAG: putative NAD/FAD-binding protein [Granulosicoccus sp.]|jgi:predicted NAD/FAD-binding protein